MLWNANLFETLGDFENESTNKHDKKFSPKILSLARGRFKGKFKFRAFKT